MGTVPFSETWRHGDTEKRETCFTEDISAKQRGVLKTHEAEVTLRWSNTITKGVPMEYAPHKVIFTLPPEIILK